MNVKTIRRLSIGIALLFCALSFGLGMATMSSIKKNEANIFTAGYAFDPVPMENSCSSTPDLFQTLNSVPTVRYLTGVSAVCNSGNSYLEAVVLLKNTGKLRPVDELEKALLADGWRMSDESNIQLMLVNSGQKGVNFEARLTLTVLDSARSGRGGDRMERRYGFRDRSFDKFGENAYFLTLSPYDKSSDRR